MALAPVFPCASRDRSEFQRVECRSRVGREECDHEGPEFAEVVEAEGRVDRCPSSGPDVHCQQAQPSLEGAPGLAITREVGETVGCVTSPMDVLVWRPGRPPLTTSSRSWWPTRWPV